jgi:hypothetical protein
MTDCKTKVDDVFKNCNDQFKSSCKNINFEPEWGTCSYNGKFPYDNTDPMKNLDYSGSTRCFRGQLIDTVNGPQLCPSTIGGGPINTTFNCTFESDSNAIYKKLIIVTIILIIISIILYLYFKKRK